MSIGALVLLSFADIAVGSAVFIRISKHQDEVTKDHRAVVAELYIDKFDAVDKLEIVKKTDTGILKKWFVNKIDLKDLHTFKYDVAITEPKSVEFVFTAIDVDGERSNTETLKIANRYGIVFNPVKRIARVTGKGGSDERLVNPNNTPDRYNVGGTDLGIIWEMGPGAYGIFFGDTYGRDFLQSPGIDWRSNVLAFSNDVHLKDGLSLSSMLTDENGMAREIVYGAKDVSGNGDWTSIPTAAIRANGADYVHYMNIRKWDGWITNHSGLYRSDDNGRTWNDCMHVRFGASSNFGQTGYVKKGAYIYMVGTETGRKSRPRLARFKEEDIEKRTEYEYWNGAKGKWLKGEETEADNLFDDTVGELSIIYHRKFDRWIMAYFCESRYNISVREADSITGPWSAPHELAHGRDYPQLYGSYIHPVSAGSEDLYFLMSEWKPYNVFLMTLKMELY